MNGRDCIAKKLHHILLQEQSLEQKERILTMFQNECHNLSVLDHPNIVTFVGVHYGRDKNDISLIMERLHSDLADYVKNNPDTNIATKIHILYYVSKDLHYLHSLTPPLIHRDLTALNILLTLLDLTAKIGDMGESTYVDPDPHVMGLPTYMPPECHVEPPTSTTKLDIFSFAVILSFTLLSVISL